MEYKRLSGDWKWKVNPDLSPDPEPPKAPKEEEPRKLCEICGFAGKDQASWNLKAHMVSKHELKYCPVSICFSQFTHFPLKRNRLNFSYFRVITLIFQNLFNQKF